MNPSNLIIGAKYSYQKSEETINVLYFKQSVNHRVFVANNLAIITLAETAVAEFIHETDQRT